MQDRILTQIHKLVVSAMSLPNVQASRDVGRLPSKLARSLSNGNFVGIN